MFRGSIRVGRLMGIPMYLHFSFLLILPFLAWAFGNAFKQSAEMAAVPEDALFLTPYLWGLVFAVALFGSIVLHELGHSWVAMRYNIRIRGITLMLFGGVAQLEEMPTRPGEEARIAIAGPMVSFAIGAICYAVVWVLDGAEYPNACFAMVNLGHLNLFLGVFNLLPAFPMDGGRVLRSVLARRRPFVQATQIAAGLGKFFALLFGIVGLVFGNFLLLFVAFFVYLGASQESQFTVIKATLDGFFVRDLMTRDVSTVPAEDTVDELIKRMMEERHLGYPVIRDGEVIGMVTLADVQKVPPGERATRRVEEIVSGEVISVRPWDDIYLALKRMSEREVGRVVVLEGGRLVGIVSRSDIMKGFQLRQLGLARV